MAKGARIDELKLEALMVKGYLEIFMEKTYFCLCRHGFLLCRVCVWAHFQEILHAEEGEEGLVLDQGQGHEELAEKADGPIRG